MKRNYFDRVKIIYLAQKDGDIYYKYFTRFISAPITAILTYTRITPNMATLAMFFFGILGGFLFSLGEAHYYILGGISFILLIVSDTVDGELARYNNISSSFGDYLDRLAHYVTNTCMILGLGIGIYNNYPDILIFYLTTIVLVFYLFDDVSRDLVISCGLADDVTSRKREKENLSVVKGSKLRKCIAYTASNTAFMHLIIIIAVLDILYVDYFNSNYKLLITYLYVIYFSLATIVKVLFRIPLIISLKNK